MKPLKEKLILDTPYGGNTKCALYATNYVEDRMSETLEQIALRVAEQFDAIAQCSYAGQAPSVSTLAKTSRSRKPKELP